jgi:hypothetical protein
VKGDERFLHKVLSIGSASSDARELTFEISAETRSEPGQQRLMRRRVAVETGQHQGAKFRFVRPQIHKFAKPDWPGAPVLQLIGALAGNFRRPMRTLGSARLTS